MRKINVSMDMFGKQNKRGGKKKKKRGNEIGSVTMKI